MASTPFTLYTAPGFESIAQQFKDNFEKGLEHGASFCVIQNGQRLVDLHGGWADRKKTIAIDEKTLFPIYSSGKAVAALIIAYLAEHDHFGYAQPVKSIWPEFDTHGKGDLSIAQILSHQAGLSGITNANWQPEDWFDWDKSCAELAAQAPIFTPCTASGYGPITYGFLAGEIARRTDVYGRHLGDILRQDICGPNGLDIWIGLPDTEHGRCADMQKPRAIADLGTINAATRAAFLEKWSSPGQGGIAQWRQAQLAGSNCHATAASLAQMMQMLLDGHIGSMQFLSEDIVQQLRQVQIKGLDQVLPFNVEFCAGILRNSPNFFYGPNAECYGHSGWGGSCVFADIKTGITAAYTMTRQGNSLMGDPRPLGLIENLYDILKNTA